MVKSAAKYGLHLILSQYDKRLTGDKSSRQYFNVDTLIKGVI